MQLSIIIVNYKSSAYICDCLASASAQLLSNQQIEWIIVDNDSNDDGKHLITRLYPFVKWIDMGYNAGFARANNAGLILAKGELVLLLNPDTLIIEGSIEACVERLLHSYHIACGVQLVHSDRSPQFSGSRFVKGGLNHLLELPYWGRFVKRVATVFIRSKPSIIKSNAEQIVDWVSGAFLMVKKVAIDNAGLLDEDFFLYAEEVEWCSRLGKQGSICIYGDIEIIHLIGTSIQTATGSVDNSYTNLSDKKGFQLMVSNHLRIRKQYGIFWFLFLLLNYTWAIPFSLIGGLLSVLFKFNNPMTELKYLFGFTGNVLRLWGITPTILIGKKHFYKCI